MHCAHCGASLISGAARCYRCQQPNSAAPTFFEDSRFSLTPPAVVAAPVARAAAHARPTPRRVAVRGDRTVNIRVAAAGAFLLGGLGLVDLVRGDSVAVLLLVAVHAAMGVGLLRKWRYAWGLGVTIAGLDVPLAFLAFLGGGSLGALLVALLALTCVIALARNGVRANIIMRAPPRREQTPQAPTRASRSR